MQMKMTGFTPRPLTLAELLDEVFRIYRANFLLLAATAFVVLIPSLVIAFLSGQATTSYASLFLAFNPGKFRSIGPGPGWSLVSGIVALLMVPFTVAAIYRAAADAVLGVPATLGSVLRGVVARYFAIWGLALIFLAGFLALIIPPVGIWILVRWTVAVPSLLVEEVGPAHAAGRSWGLVRGRWWRTLGTVILALILSYIVLIVISVIFGLFASLPGLTGGFHAGIRTLGSSIATALVNPILALTITLIYMDLRSRKENLDLNDLARRANTAAGPAGPPAGPGGWASPPPPPPPGPPAGSPPPPPPPSSGAWPPPPPPSAGPPPPDPNEPGGPPAG